MRVKVQLSLGLAIAVGLLVAAVWLWLHNLIIVGAPVGALAAGVGWAAVDNTLIYPAERARRAAATAEDGGAPEPTEVTAHQTPS